MPLSVVLLVTSSASSIVVLPETLSVSFNVVARSTSNVPLNVVLLVTSSTSSIVVLPETLSVSFNVVASATSKVPLNVVLPTVNTSPLTTRLSRMSTSPFRSESPSTMSVGSGLMYLLINILAELACTFEKFWRYIGRPSSGSYSP